MLTLILCYFVNLLYLSLLSPPCTSRDTQLQIERSKVEFSGYFRQPNGQQVEAANQINWNVFLFDWLPSGKCAPHLHRNTSVSTFSLDFSPLCLPSLLLICPGGTWLATNIPEQGRFNVTFKKTKILTKLFFEYKHSLYVQHLCLEHLYCILEQTFLGWKWMRTQAIIFRQRMTWCSVAKPLLSCVPHKPFCHHDYHLFPYILMSICSIHLPLLHFSTSPLQCALLPLVIHAALVGNHWPTGYLLNAPQTPMH